VDIAEFLTACLDAEEAAARATSSLRWRTDDPFGSDIVIPADEPSYAANGKAVASCMETNGYRPGSLPDAAHIAYWDPARVLADIAAKRAIVAEHASTDDGSGVLTVCRVCSYRDIWERYSDPAPCRTLRLLAAVYTSHPDFDPAWRTDG
jgi:hypothetical protein